MMTVIIKDPETFIGKNQLLPSSRTPKIQNRFGNLTRSETEVIEYPNDGTCVGDIFFSSQTDREQPQLLARFPNFKSRPVRIRLQMRDSVVGQCMEPERDRARMPGIKLGQAQIIRAEKQLLPCLTRELVELAEHRVQVLVVI